MPLIQSSHWRLWLDPEIGVQWMAAEVRSRDDWHAIVPDCRDNSVARLDATTRSRVGQNEQAPLAAANFHMLPYSNRIRDGKFQFAGQSVQLGRAAAHAIHGALRKQPWRTTLLTESELHCEYDSDADGAVDWPWAIQAAVRHRIDDARLSSEIILSNRADTPMPAGFGWHPYFVRTVGGVGPNLRVPVSGVFPDASGDCLPDGASVELPAALDFRTTRTLDPDQRIDCCLSGLSGPVMLEWPGAGIQLTMTASDICEYLVLFNPDMPHFAVEPVTNANDAFNLTTRNIDSGTQVLQPGESLSATMTLDLTSADA